MYGPLSLTRLATRHDATGDALPMRSFYAVHSRPSFFRASDFNAIVDDPAVIGLHVSVKDYDTSRPFPGSLYAWALERAEGAASLSAP